MTKEIDFLKNWHLKLAIIAAIIVPTVTATSALYSFRSKIEEKIQEDRAVVSAKISALELQSQKDFVEKSSIKDMQRNMEAMHDDIVEIKTILKKRL